jgi:sulfide:quinone oxidoreductase
MNAEKFRILILGGGTGGISVAARLIRKGFSHQIALIEPSEFHAYQPYWTLAGAGLVTKESSRKTMASVMPSHVKWIRDSVQAIHPEKNQVETSEGRLIQYEVLVVALGLEVNYEKIEGVEESLGKNGVISIYQYEQIDACVRAIQTFQGGTAIFTMPPVPIKCAGAPQKIMYLADSLWRKSGVRQRSKVIFSSAGMAIFGIKEFADALNKVVAKKEIETRFQTKLVAVNGEKKVATFEKTVNGSVIREEMAFDLLHVVPPMSAPQLIRTSVLASTEETQKGWLAVDKFTLQHLKFPNVFGVGDVIGVPNSKTGAAIRKQAPIVAENIRKFLNQETDFLKYDGYSSCPLVTDIGKVILAEFGYDGKLMPSFPLDPTKERRIYWILKKDLLPPMYWHGMLKGRM